MTTIPTTTPIPNLAVEFLEKEFEQVEDYGGICGELTDGIIHWLGEDRVSILHLEEGSGGLLLASDGWSWKYHMVPIIDGNVHDAWHPRLVLPPAEYIQQAFPGQAVRAAHFGGEHDGEEISNRAS